MKYRKSSHRLVHPKIFVWSHTEKAEEEYFKAFKNHLQTSLLITRQKTRWDPQELIEHVIEWLNNQGRGQVDSESDDQVWCVFDVDDFYKSKSETLLRAVTKATTKNIKIAYSNECLELWFLLHFNRINASIPRDDFVSKINAAFKKHGLGEFKKNDPVFDILLPFQDAAINNATAIYCENDTWHQKLGPNGNPSTSIHLLVKEIKQRMGTQDNSLTSKQ